MISKIICSQIIYPKDYFAYPVKNDFIVLSNFGDFRANHFHTGLDVRTGDGNKIFCAADGYISRVKVSPVGYGNAVYVAHPNGYTTVYAHLKAYSEKINAYVKRKQYLNHDFSVEFFPDSGEVEICKNEIIGYSGNTGMSYGSHLHFEIRNTVSEHIINPLLFYKYSDNKPPVITRIHIYPFDNKSTINGKNSRQSFDIKKSRNKSGKPILAKAEKIVLAGRIGFGIETYDLDDNSKDKSNIYSVDININDTLSLYKCRFEEFSFDDKRNVNSYLDFKEYYAHYKSIQRCFVEPNNKTPIYSNLINQGIFDFNNDENFNVTIKIGDVNNNISTLDFKVKGTKTEKEFIEEKDEYVKVMAYEDVNYFVKDDIMISFPEDIFYDTVFFDYKRIEAKKGFYSAIHNIHDKYTPLNKKIVLSIKSDNVPKNLLDKAILVSLSKNGAMTSLGGQINNNYIVAETFEFGSFAIAIDTILPEIKVVNVYNYEDLTLGKTIRCKISDNLSGVKSFAGFIDGRWVLFEYDKKTNLITYTFEDTAIYGELHCVEVFVEDVKGNKTSVGIPFYR